MTIAYLADLMRRAAKPLDLQTLIAPTAPVSPEQAAEQAHYDFLLEQRKRRVAMGMARANEELARKRGEPPKRQPKFKPRRPSKTKGGKT